MRHLVRTSLSHTYVSFIDFLLHHDDKLKNGIKENWANSAKIRRKRARASMQLNASQRRTVDVAIKTFPGFVTRKRKFRP